MNFWRTWRNWLALIVSFLAIIITVITSPERIELSRETMLIFLLTSALAVLLLIIRGGIATQLDEIGQRIEKRLKSIESKLSPSQGGNPGSQLPSRPQPPPRPPETTGKGAVGGGLIGAGVGFLAGGPIGLILGAIIGAAIGDQAEKTERRRPPR
jgi:cytochrome c biogenesis protein CcdA